MFKINTEHLLLINGVLWTAVGTRIGLIGINSYFKIIDTHAFVWMIPLSIIVFIGFFMMFTAVVRKYANRIYAMTEEKVHMHKVFSLQGYLIIGFMITMGVSLQHIHSIPTSFFAWFYMGLGPGLLSAGIRFIIRWIKRLKDNNKL